ncbi:MAG: MATE family efflux transporter [bacterium]|nr:MATE family efflux transporter [bacterium]
MDKDTGHSIENQIFLRKSFLRFFVPSVLSSLALAVGGLGDCLFVGSQIGTDGLIVIGFGAPVYALYSLISIGISTGASIHYSKALSEGDQQKGREIFQNTLLFIFLIILTLSVLGIIFRPTVLHLLGVRDTSPVYPLMYEYISVQLGTAPLIFMQAPFYYFVHCDNNPKLAAIALVSANVTDVVMNYILIVILKVGILGSIYSTICAAVITISLCMFHLLSKKTVLGFGRSRVCFRHVTDGIKTGYATNAQYAYQFIVILTFNQLLMRTWGENGVACLDVVTNIGAVVVAVIEGVGLTLQPMIATFYGERNKKNIKNTLRYTYLWGGAVCALLLLLIIYFAPWYCPVFGLAEGDVLEGGIWAIRVFMLSIPVTFTVSVFSYFYQTIEKERLSYLLILISEAIGRLLFGTLLIRFGFHSFWWCYLCSELLTLLILVCYCLSKKSFLFLDFKEAVFTAFLSSKSEELSQVTEQIQNFCEEQGASIKQSYFVTMVVDEISSAIFMRQTKQAIYIQLTVVKENEETFVLHIRDNNQNDYNPFDTDTSDLHSEAENENAIGMKLVESKAKEFFYRQYSGFNTLVIKI